MITLNYRQKQALKFTPAIILLIFAGTFKLNQYIAKHITFNDTPSEPIGVYKLEEPGKIESGLIYTIAPSTKYLAIAQQLGYSGDGYFLKRIVGVPGDHIKITESGIFVNNNFLVASQAQNFAKGVNLYPLPVGYNHILGRNEYWTYGNGLHSFDSRYYGVITYDNIHNKATFWFFNEGVNLWLKHQQSLWSKRSD